MVLGNGIFFFRHGGWSYDFDCGVADFVNLGHILLVLLYRLYNHPNTLFKPTSMFRYSVSPASPTGTSHPSLLTIRRLTLGKGLPQEPGRPSGSIVES